MYNIVAGLQKKEIILLVKLKEQKDKIIGKDIHKKEKSFLISDLIYTFPDVYSQEEKALEALSNLEFFFKERITSFEPLLIYELLIDQYKEVSFKELEPLLLNHPQEIDRLALKHFFLSHPIYFHFDLTKNILLLASKDSVEKALHDQQIQKEAELKKQKAQQDLLMYVQKSLEGEKFTEFSPSISSYIKDLKDFCIFEDQSTHKQSAEKILQFLHQHFPKHIYLNGNLYYEAFKILSLIGYFKEDYNLLLERYDISPEFLVKEESEVLDINEMKILNEPHRKDLTKLLTITIDGEDTKDFDDALSFKKLDNEYIIYVHIADVASYIQPHSLLEQCAQNRHRTLYMVDENILMFPPVLSQDILALKENKESCAITYEFHFSLDFKLQSYSIVESMIRVDHNYTYDQIDQWLHSGIIPERDLDFLPALLEISQALQKQRIDDNDGVDILLPQVSPYLKEEQITLKVYNPQEKSGFIIRELMILTNSLSAHYMDQDDFPFIYLCQEQPTEEVKLENRIIKDKIEFAQLGKFMKKSYMDTQNIGHYALGLHYYTQITSPIRRYIDILNQRQLKQKLKGLAPLYSKEELSDEILRQDAKKSIGNTLENERQKYYLLKYLSLYKKDIPLEGIIIKCLSESDYLVEIIETQTICKAKASLKQYTLWEKVEVQLHTIYPRLGLSLGNIL